MVTIEIKKAEGYHKFLVSFLRYDGSLLWSYLLVAEKTEEVVKNFCDMVEGRCVCVEVCIVAERSVLKELGLLWVKKK